MFHFLANKEFWRWTTRNILKTLAVVGFITLLLMGSMGTIYIVHLIFANDGITWIFGILFIIVLFVLGFSSLEWKAKHE